MSLDPHAQRLLALLSGAGASSQTPSPAQRRAALEDLARMAGGRSEPSVAEVATEQFQGPRTRLGVRRYRPMDDGRDIILYLHGGGWVAGDLDTHDGVCRALARGSGAEVVALDYRRAPEDPFPAALEDTLAALAWLAQDNAPATRIGLAGDSAGANIAAAAAIVYADAAKPPPLAVLLLICPILDLTVRSPSRLHFANAYFVRDEALERDLGDYLGADGRTSDPRVSPLLAADLTGLPPTHLHAAEYDPFRDEAASLAERLRRAGVTVDCTIHAGMIHYFYAVPRAIPGAHAALATMAAQLRSTLAASRR